MKRIIVAVIGLLIALSAQSQEFTVKSFAERTNDLSASTNVRKDLNGTPCALVKVQLAASGAHFEPNVVGEVAHKVNEYWVYLPVGSKHLKVSHPNYVTSDIRFSDYGIESLSSKTTYEAVVLLPDAAPAANVVTSQYLVFRVEPKDAMVEVNGQIWTLENGVAIRLVNLGRYDYRVQLKDYHSEVGSVAVEDASEKVEVEVNLKPAYGSISVSGGNLAGANVYIDDAFMGTAPYTVERIASGIHTVRIVKNMYRTYEQSVTVSDGKVTKLSPSLEANFKSMTVVAPNGSEIWINDEKRGSGTWTGNLGYGIYRIEARKSSHRSVPEEYTVSELSENKIVLDTPIPIYGGLNISVRPYDAEICLDGRRVGTSPMLLQQVLVGDHELRLSKEGYGTLTGKVTVKENVTASFERNLEKESPKQTVQTSSAQQSGSSMINGHEYVDLGLSVKWATCNVGASRPEECGNYYAWGETAPKRSYDWSNLKYCNDDTGDSFSKYNQNRGGTRGRRTCLELSDDAARQNWGGSWRMPTEAEFKELKDNCDCKWTSRNGVAGAQFTSRKNGKSIFLPAAGNYYGSSLGNQGSNCSYWSSSLYQSYSYNAWYLYFGSDGAVLGDYGRRYGFPVRPVSE